jgi:uncharacterized surface protein with fasciclin (FAS1) repeats
MKKFSVALLFASLILFTIVGYANGSAPKNIYETAKGAGNFNTLVAALDKANLSEVFKGSGNYTVFAPTDEAFKKLLKEKNLTAEDLLSHPKLSDILKYHVIGQKFLASDVVKLENGTKVETLSTGFVTVTKSNGKVMINDSEIVTTDILASNGVIHVINKVLVPDGFFEAKPPQGSTSLGAIRATLSLTIRQLSMKPSPNNNKPQITSDKITTSQTLGQVQDNNPQVAPDKNTTPQTPGQVQDDEKPIVSPDPDPQSTSSASNSILNFVQIFLVLVGSLFTSLINFVFKK